jgi:hypothetical protein
MEVLHVKSRLPLVLATVLMISGVAIAYQYPSFRGTVSILEPITLSPPQLSLSAYPNQRFSLNFTVTNHGPTVIFLTINASVIEAPLGGNLTDIRFIVPNPFIALPGANMATITAVVDNGAVPGTYRIQVTFCRLSEANRRCG